MTTVLSKLWWTHAFTHVSEYLHLTAACKSAAHYDTAGDAVIKVYNHIACCSLGSDCTEHVLVV